MGKGQINDASCRELVVLAHSAMMGTSLAKEKKGGRCLVCVSKAFAAISSSLGGVFVGLGMCFLPALGVC